MNKLCPCGTEKLYNQCCKIWHEGALPANALVLMRSRYSAYALHLPDYIIHTTHPNNPSFEENYNLWFKEILYFCQNTHFKKLEIVNFVDGEQESYVTFIAHLLQNNEPKKLAEKSHFEKVGNKWLYLSGVFLDSL